MQRLLLLAALYFVSCAADDVKNATAEGNYDPQHNGYGHHHDGHGYETYAPPQPQYGAYAYQFLRPLPPPLVDRDVCDLDASVLLVAQSKRHGRHDRNGQMNRAYRVRCSVIANYDEDSCNICCQHAARRDKNLQNKQFVGFLAVTDDIDEDHSGDDRRGDRIRDSHDDDDRRGDRSRDSHYDDDHGRYKRHDRDQHYSSVDPIKVTEGEFKPGSYYKNVKCVCCAPKRPLPPPPVIPQPIFAQPTYQQTAQPVYQTVAQAQPAYAQTAQIPAPAQSVYQATAQHQPY